MCLAFDYSLEIYPPPNHNETTNRNSDKESPYLSIDNGEKGHLLTKFFVTNHFWHHPTGLRTNGTKKQILTGVWTPLRNPYFFQSSCQKTLPFWCVFFGIKIVIWAYACIHIYLRKSMKKIQYSIAKQHSFSTAIVISRREK